ncbi:uncharacterized protein AMSG_05158 [Thecamonas trahens ATCC 50062]|uniref:Pentacotripeptide-repeat region of PRORP domain-containing protein n=1 Tax=Thecamonas trahens ATCC 50062 TaxID=461836 RepID=A0A0L0DCX8_THETB|nr:hypothetical protein AMSG_05158 [Thecamonas trahens ATCC 50062]KNC49178.1 hypothetical protein AMSG_05158 [Thecamonas trahens ATCC 50062]|eukprot:XP_013758198.1 hypothetical protein AMSG_05158 [Thecamonas trahens ATCC 50062]
MFRMLAPLQLGERASGGAVSAAVGAVLRAQSTGDVEAAVDARSEILSGPSSDSLTSSQCAKLILKLTKFGVCEPVRHLFARYHSLVMEEAERKASGADGGSGETLAKAGRVYDAMLTMHCKQNDVVGTESVLAQRAAAAVPLSTQTYNTLLYFYGVRKEFDKVEATLAEMRAKGLPESLTTYSIRIKGLLSVGMADEAADVFDAMVAAGLEPNRYIYQTLISYFLKQHEFDKVDQLMSAMADANILPNVVLYTNIIDTYLKADDFDEAKRVYSTMLAERVKPNVATFTSFIQAYLKAGDIDSARLMFQNMLDLGIAPTVRTHTAFLVYYTRAGDDAAAKDTLDTILALRPSKLDRIVYTAIMQPLYKAGETSQACAVFDSMFANRVFPDARPYNMMMALYLKDGDMAAAADILDLMATHKHPFKLWSLLFAEKRLVAAIDPAVLDAFVLSALSRERAYKLSNRDMRFLVRQFVFAGMADAAVRTFAQGPALMGASYSRSTYNYLAGELNKAGIPLPDKAAMAAVNDDPRSFATAE